jgi:hypothetical protein
VSVWARVHGSLLAATGTFVLSLALDDVHLHVALDVMYSRRDIESLVPTDRSACTDTTRPRTRVSLTQWERAATHAYA